VIRGAVFVLLLAVAAAFAVSVLRARDSEGQPIFASAEERAAGQVALRFANLDRNRDATHACELTAGELRRDMRCDRAPRPSGLLEYGHDEPFRVIGAVSSQSGLIYIHVVPGNAAASIAVNRQGKVQSISQYATA